MYRVLRYLYLNVKRCVIIVEIVLDIKICFTEVENCFSIFLLILDEFFFGVELFSEFNVSDCLRNVKN